MHRHAIRQLTNRSGFLAAPSGLYISSTYAKLTAAPVAVCHVKVSTASREPTAQRL
jgi:hypothetical protein